MAATQRVTVHRKGDIDGLLEQDARITLSLQLSLTRLKRLLDRTPSLADPLAGLRLGRRWQRADLTVGQGQRGPVPRMGKPHFLQLSQVCRAGDRRCGIGNHGVDRGRVKGGDLLGVERGVRAGHGGPFCSAEGSSAVREGTTRRGSPARVHQHLRRDHPCRGEQVPQLSAVRTPDQPR